MFSKTPNRVALLLIISLLSTYFIWGTTYLAIRFGIESFPPFMLAGVRFAIAGLLMYGILRAKGIANPTISQWRGAALIGILMPALGNGTVCYVQQTVSSSVAALSIATVPIWMAIFSVWWGHRIAKQEWLGIIIGLLGIVLLNVGGSLHGDLFSAMLLLFAAASWAFGSVLGQYIVMPKGMMSAACQMIAGGFALMIASFIAGESWPAQISVKSWGAMLYLLIFSSIVAYTAYQWLLRNVRPLVASSNTFVNPVVAFVFGIWLANEQIATNEYWALAVIIVGVVLILTAVNEKETH